MFVIDEDPLPPISMVVSTIVFDRRDGRLWGGGVRAIDI